MADKSFGVKKIELLGDGTPTIESPNDLNLNANTVAISTNLSVGNRVSVSSGVVTSISGVVTYYGDGQYLTGISVDQNVVGTSLSISGISTLGVTSVTDLTAQDLDVSGIASVGAAITMYGATGIISATQYYGDGSKLTGIGAATTANIVAETLKVTGVSTLGDVQIGAGITIDASSGISTFYAVANTLNVNTGTTNAAINIQYGGDTKGSLTPKSDGLEIQSVADDDVSVHVNSVGGNSGDFIVKSNGTDLLKIDAGDVKSTFSTDVNVGSAITMYQATGIISATKFFGDGSGLTGAGVGTDGNINTTGIITASAFAGFDYLQAPYGSTVTFTVTVAGKDATHRYNGTGSGNGYLINGVQAPILTLTPGRTYRFTNDNTGSHPFKFYYKADKTTEYTTGVNFQNSYTEITISDTTPNVLHYQCTAHAYMGNAIITNSNVVDSPYPATLRDGLSVSGISSVGSAITMYGTSGIISATKFIGDGSSLTGITADTLGDLATLKVTGLSTFNGNMDINADVDISGALSIGGTLTYEDVTNVDSIGLITARDGIAVLGSGVTVTGLSTFYSDLNVGSAITMLSSSGIVSATKFYGDGSNLSGISADTIGDLSKLVVTGIATFQSNIGVAGSVTTDLLHVGYSTSLSLALGYNPSVQQVGTDNSSSTHGIFRFSSDASAPSFRFIKSRSSDPSGKGIVQNGDELGTIFFIGDDGNDFANGGAAIKATVDGTPSATADMPTKLSFHTALDGSAFARERLTIRNTGDVGIGTIDPTGTGALTSNDAVLAVGVVTAIRYFGDGSNLTGVGGGTSPGQVAFASTAGISTLTSSWSVTNDNADHYEFTGPGNLSSTDDPTIYLQRGQKYEFVINASGHPFQIRKKDNSAYTDGVTYSGGGSSVSVGTVTIDVPFDAPSELKYVCTSHAGAMNGIIYVSDAAGIGNTNTTGVFENLEVSAASTLGSVKVSSGIITATSGIVTFYGDGQYLTGITAEGTGAIGGLTVKDEGSTVGTAGSVSTINFVGDIVSAAANTGAAGVATVTVSVKDAQENIYLGTGSGNASDSDTCFNVGIGYSAGCSLNSGDNNILMGKESGSKCLTSGQYNTILGCKAGQCANPTCSIFIGNYAGRNINGNDNIFLGSGAGRGVGASAKDACHNVAIGNGAGTCIDQGDRNIFIGNIAGSNTQSGGCNVFLGWCAGRTNTSGTHNISLGADSYSGGANGFGSYNVLFGKKAGENLGTGSRNIMIGCCAGGNVTSADKNILIGGYAGGLITEGDDNIIMGQASGTCLSTGCYNVIFGPSAGKNNETGNDNIAIGRYAGYGHTSGGGYCHNISMGLWSGRCLSTGGNHNIQFGCYTNRHLTTGSYNIAIGHSVGVASSTGDYQLAIGQIDNRWITGDSSFNVTLSGIATVYKATGIVSATKFCGDGSCLSGTGFTQDSQGNLVAGTGAGAAKDADTCYNIMLGCNAGTALNEGDYNVLMGLEAGKCITSGSQNFVFGPYSGCSINSGSANFLVGYGAGKNITTGCKNIAFLGGDSMGATACCNIVMGNEAGYNLTGNSNIALGAQAGCDLTGSDNILLGGYAGTEMTSGSCNIALGKCAMKSGTVTGNLNIAIGYRSGDAITSATNNVLIGCDAGRSLTTSSALANVFIGRGAGASAETGCFSVAIGCGTLNNMKGLGCNIAFGRRAGQNMCTGTHNFFAGNYTAQWVLGGSNIAIGQWAMQCMTNVSDSIALGEYALVGSSTTTSNTGDVNIAMGPQSSRLVTTGGCNITIGYRTGCKITTGSQNIAIGKNALINGTTTGSDNIVMGEDAGCKISSGGKNIALGHQALSSGTVTGDNNIALGDGAGKCVTSGTNNVLLGCYAGCAIADNHMTVAIGYYAGRNGANSCGIFMGFSAGQVATGNCNIMIGPWAGSCTTSGCGNIFIGEYVGKLNTEGKCNIFLGACAACSNTTGDKNIAIGCMVQLASATGDCQLAIGQSTDRWIIGDSSYNVCLAGSTIKAMNSGGIFCATKFVGDGSSLTGIATVTGINTTTTSTFNDLTVTGVSTFLGSVGIGTTNSNHYKLRVDAGAAKSAFQVVGSTGTLLDVVNDATSDIFSANDVSGINAFKINKDRLITMSLVGAGDSVGIGTTLPRSSSKLDVEGIVKATSFLGDGSSLTGISAGFTTTGSNNLVAGYNAGCNIASGGCNNVILGTEAGKNLTTADSNVFIGMYAGCSFTDNGIGANVYIGCNAGRNAGKNGSQIAFYNVALGYGALWGDYSNGSGTCHTIAIGNMALSCSTTGMSNVAIGHNAGCKSSTAGKNFLGGYYAGRYNTTGGCNVYIGGRAAQTNRTGVGNVVIGNDAACSATNSADCNFHTSVFIGQFAAKKIQGGSNNVVIGEYAGCNVETPYGNVFIGAAAGKCNSTGYYNTLIGNCAGCNDVITGCCNIAIGHKVQIPSPTSDLQLAIGCRSCNWIVGNSNWNVGIGTTNPDAAVGVGNTAKLSVGILSAYQLYGDGSNLTGLSGFTPDAQQNLYAGTGAGASSDADTCWNIGIGQSALYSQDASGSYDGEKNIAIGCLAMCKATGGKEHVAIGRKAGAGLVAGYNNVFIGSYAGGNASCSINSEFNIGIGYGALRSVTGHCNIAFGYEAMALGTGSHNFAAGRMAGGSNLQSSNNVFIGECATKFGQSGNGNNIVIGKRAAYCATSFSHSIIMGNCAGYRLTAANGCNIFMGKNAAGNTGADVTGVNNIIMGTDAGLSMTSGNCNIFFGRCAGNTNTSGDFNIAIGDDVELPSATGDYQLAIGSGTNRWIAGDSSYNVTLAGIVTATAAGAVCATTYHGDGSNLTGISAGFSPDADENLVAGTNAGANLDGTNACFNIFLGFCAGKDATSAAGNIAIGKRTGESLTSGSTNTFVGNSAGFTNCSGSHNSFFGNAAGYVNTTGSCNVAIGHHALLDNTTASYNTAVGHCAGASVKTGSRNAFFGSCAGKCTEGTDNTFLGSCAGKYNHSSSYNTLIGRMAGANTSGGGNTVAIGVDVDRGIGASCHNVYIGNNAARENGESSNNVYIGSSAGYNTCQGKCNVIIGRCAGYSVCCGHKNVFLGYEAGNTNTNGCCNIAIGFNVELPSATANSQFAIGVDSNRWLTGDSSYNVTLAGIATAYASGIVSATKFCGDGSCLSNLPGFSPDDQQNLVAGTLAGAAKDADTCFNIFLGCSAGAATNEGDFNTFIGAYSGACNTAGACNVAIGCKVLCCNTAGTWNIAIGAEAGKKFNYTSSGGCNIYMGNRAGCGGSGTVDGVNNIMMGLGAGTGIEGGDCNIFMGRYAAKDVTSGSNNIALGASAAENLTSGSDNIAIGCYAMCAGAVTGTANVAIGRNAGKNLVGGGCNVFLGLQAGTKTNSGNDNIALGRKAMNCGTTGGKNVALGFCALHGDASTAPTGGENVSIGYETMMNATTAQMNTAVGSQALNGVTTGQYNSAFGYAAGRKITTGKCNIAIGHYALCGGPATGCHNIVMGHYAAHDMTSGNKNVVIGCCVNVSSASGSCQLAIGAGTNYWLQGDSSFDLVTNNIVPSSNNSKNLGSDATRWANIYTNDLQLSNKGKTNDVDGTWGDFTIQEGENDLFLINNRSGKKYKFNLTEVS